MPIRVLIVGANSAIALAVCRLYAKESARLFLVSRSGVPLEANAADLRVRGASEVQTSIVDAAQIDVMADALASAWWCWNGFDVVLVALGVLPDQEAVENSTQLTLSSFDVNARAVLAILTDVANRMAFDRRGIIGVISSPAGDRGRATNYVYGAAKAAVSTFAAGLRQRLRSRGVRVLTIIPGPVDSPMTAALPKSKLWAEPARVARDIRRALDGSGGTLYTPWFWRWIMLLIRHVPEWVLARTKL